MQDLQQTLLRFFERVAQKDPALLEVLEDESGFVLEPGCWCFTLPGLHTFLQDHDPSFRAVEYGQFRQLIFQSAINQALKSQGAEITLHENKSKVDQSSYALTWKAVP
ncbi:MAG: hypothetical protein F4X93_05745 [Proteobacteria bacterium]|nr:hypothetical protein [Pseudomonadota bacterium]